MICQLCKGAKWLLSLWPMEWWRCPACDGHGARTQYGPEKTR